jgi:hypothetical protein
MSHAKKDTMPDWFPFALTASFLVMIGAGIRSNWGRATAAAEPPPPPAPSTAPVQQAGIVHGALSEWGVVRFG